jgi:hypothetical protein
MLVRLSEAEVEAARMLGRKRHECSLNRKSTRGLMGEDSLDLHTVGAIGEFAVAKALNLYQGFTVNNFDGPDIEPDIQVRTTRLKGGRLIMTERDEPFQKYVLVVGEEPELDVVGWVWGFEGQEKKWLTDPKNNRPPAYFVPRDALRPIETLHAG